MNLASLGETLATLWTVWAVALFCGLGFWALRPSNRPRCERDARSPHDDES